MDLKSRKIAGATALALMVPMAPALAEPSSNAITTGLGYSSQHGAVATLGFEAVDIKGSGLDVGLEYRRGDTGNGGRLRLRHTADLGATFFGANTSYVTGLTASGSDWQDQSYSSQTARFVTGLTAQNPGGLFYQAQVFWQDDYHYDEKPTASPLVVAEMGRSTAGGLLFGIGLDTLNDPALPTQGYSLEATLTQSIWGDRHFSALDLASSYAHPLSDLGAVVLRFETGAIEGQDGQTVSIHDRAFMGGTAPRGFAVGGAGPHDTAVGYDSPLGGNRYVLATVEARRTVNPSLTLGAFGDVGAAWGLEGPAYAAIDDSLHLRSSVGASVYWTTGAGTMRLNVAVPTNKEKGDELNPLSLEFVSTF